MKILLTKDVSGIGRAGDIKEVSEGHARNFLIPKGYGVPATQNLVAKVAKENQEKNEKQQREQQKFIDLAAKLGRITVTIKAKASKENLFGAIHEDSIVEALKSKLNIEVEPQKIIIEKPIKTIGLHQVTIKVSPNHKALITVDIQPL